MNWKTVFSKVALFHSGSCVQNCQRDASLDYLVRGKRGDEERSWGWKGREETKKEVEAEAQAVHGKSAVAARSVEEDFSICSENDGQIGVDKLFRVALVLGLCSAWGSRVILFACSFETLRKYDANLKIVWRRRGNPSIKCSGLMSLLVTPSAEVWLLLTYRTAVQYMF